MFDKIEEWCTFVDTPQKWKLLAAEIEELSSVLFVGKCLPSHVRFCSPKYMHVNKSGIVEPLLSAAPGSFVLTNKDFADKCAELKPRTENNLLGSKALFHGGCIGCTNLISSCPNCCYMLCDWSLPDLNPRQVDSKKQTYVEMALRQSKKKSLTEKLKRLLDELNAL